MGDLLQLGSRLHGVARSWRQYREACEVLPWGTGTGSKRPLAALADDQPAQIGRARGSRVWDVDGNEYIDFRLGCGPITLGYGHPLVDQAAKKQINRGVLTSLPVDLERRAAKLLVELVPCAEMARFMKGGGEAMYAATRLARHVTHRDRVVTCGYHGWHLTMDDTQPDATRRAARQSYSGVSTDAGSFRSRRCTSPSPTLKKRLTMRQPHSARR
jgi:glutamate-1-semialdehyde aminotransferase